MITSQQAISQAVPRSSPAISIEKYTNLFAKIDEFGLLWVITTYKRIETIDNYPMRNFLRIHVLYFSKGLRAISADLLTYYRTAI